MWDHPTKDTVLRWMVCSSVARSLQVGTQAPYFSAPHPFLNQKRIMMQYMSSTSSCLINGDSPWQTRSWCTGHFWNFSSVSFRKNVSHQQKQTGILSPPPPPRSRGRPLVITSQKSGEATPRKVRGAILARTSEPSEQSESRTQGSFACRSSSTCPTRQWSDARRVQKNQGNVDLLELKDLDRFINCPKCGSNNRLGSFFLRVQKDATRDPRTWKELSSRGYAREYQ